MRSPLALIACTVLAASPARAETTRSFEVSARVVPGCLVATDAGGRWGTIDLGSVPGVSGTSAEATLVSTAGAGVSIECTPGLAGSLSADGGDHAGGGERFLLRGGGGATVRYRLYANGATTPWSIAGALPLVFGTGRTLVPIRAVATLAGPAAAGTYTDTIRVTLSW